MLLLLLIDKTVKYGTCPRRTPIKEEESFFFSFFLILKLIILIKQYFKIQYDFCFFFFFNSLFNFWKITTQIRFWAQSYHSGANLSSLVIWYLCKFISCFKHMPDLSNLYKEKKKKNSA